MYRALINFNGLIYRIDKSKTENKDLVTPVSTDRRSITVEVDAKDDVEATEKLAKIIGDYHDNPVQR